MKKPNQKKKHRYAHFKHWIKRYLPHPHKIRDHKHLQIFGKRLADPNIWHLNRHSVATAFSIGLFWAYIPTPGQMPLAALFSILFKANLPIAVALVWVSNPLTSAPMFFFAYKIGAWVLGQPVKAVQFEATFSWFFYEMRSILVPALLGSVICGLGLAILSNIFIRLIWRYSIIRAWKARLRRRKAKQRRMARRQRLSN